MWFSKRAEDPEAVHKPYALRKAEAIHKPYALKGQKLLAQGNALGINGIPPCAL